MKHKFPYNWTLKGSKFQSEKGKVFHVLQAAAEAQWAINLQALKSLGVMKLINV